MNRKLLALAVGAALSLPLAAQAAPTVYGQLNLSVDMADIESADDPTTPLVNEAVDAWQVNSNASRLGIKGEESLGNGLSAVYMAEWGVSGDGTAADLGARNRYLGLKGSFGTVKLGHYDSPLKTSQGTVDQFNDMTYTDMGALISGENRMHNLIGYESPLIADVLTVSVAIQPGETTGTDDGLADGISAAVAYQASGLYLALGYDKAVSDGAFVPLTNRDTIRATATYTMDMLSLGALLQTSENSDEAVAGQDDEKALLLSAAYAMGQGALKAQVIMAKRDFGTPDEQETLGLAVGYDHNFTQQTKAYAQLGMAKTDNLGGAANTNADDTVLTVGMLTKF